MLRASTAVAGEPRKQECVAANERAQDLRQAGKLREMHAPLALCLSESCPGAVRDDCAERMRELDAVTPTVVFEAKDAAGHALNAVRVTVDGDAFADKLDGTPLAVDPGAHRFAFDVRGMRTQIRSLVFREGEKDRHETVVFGASAARPAIPAPEAGAQGPEGDSTSDGDSRTTIGLVLGGTGAVALVVGSVLGVVSKSTYDHALNRECGAAAGFADAKMCNASGVSGVQLAHGEAAAATATFVAGALLLGGGAYLVLTVPKGGEVALAPRVDRRSASLTLQTSW
jgi:hypothetical protein